MNSLADAEEFQRGGGRRGESIFRRISAGASSGSEKMRPAASKLPLFKESGSLVTSNTRSRRAARAVPNRILTCAPKSAGPPVAGVSLPSGSGLQTPLVSASILLDPMKVTFDRVMLTFILPANRVVKLPAPCSSTVSPTTVPETVIWLDAGSRSNTTGAV